MESKKAYRESLSQLNTELANIDVPSGSPTAAVVDGLLQDVRGVLDNPGDLPFAHHRTLMEKLEEAELAFSVDHPTLTGTVRSVIQSLNAIGI